MPHSTVRYKFEFEILKWAEHFSHIMTSENRGFLILLDLNGAVQRIFLGDGPRHFNLAMKEALVKSSQGWFFYHPFDAPEYTWIEWQNVRCNTFERLLGQPLEETALFSLFCEIDKLIDFPTSWQVMF